MKLNYSTKLKGIKNKGIAFIASLFLILCSINVNAQLTGTKNIPGDYGSLSAAITDLNTQGVGAGGVIINLIAGNPETAPVGGYAITTLTGTAANPITIVGNSNIITANSALLAGSLNDAIFKIIGADYVTISGFSMQENSANTVTTAVSNTMTEFGVALFYASNTDGAQNNNIVGNTITLNKTYLNTWGIYSNVRHDAINMTTTADITASTGANSNNKVYGNIISNVNMGIAFIGSATAANMDSGNDIGGTSLTTGNTISNWGGAAAASSYVSNSGTSYGILINHQTGENVQYNTLTSAAVSGASVTFRGIYKTYTASAPTGTFVSTISNNTITMTSAFNGGTFNCIASDNMGALTTASLSINNNTFLNCALTSVGASGGFVGITNSSAPGTLNINGNIIQGTTSSATSGAFTAITNTGAVANVVNINNNQIGNATANAITFSAASTTSYTVVTNSNVVSAAVSISNNDFRGFVNNVATTSSITFINNSNSASSNTVTINGNTFTNLSINSSGGVTFFNRSGNMTATGAENVTNNSIVTGFTKLVGGGTVIIRAANASSVTGSSMTETGNNFSNITLTGATTFTGWSNTEGASSASGPNKIITGNTMSNIIGGTSTVTTYSLNFSQAVTFTGNTCNSVTGQGTVQGLVIGTSNGNVHNYSNNTFTNYSSTGTGGNVNGITGGNTVITSLTISGNTINNLSSTGASSTVTGIAITTGPTTTNINGNIINGLSSSGTTSPLVRGITVAAGTTVNVFKNKIYNLSVSGAISTTNSAVNGILISSGTTVNTYNNIIGELTAPAASLTDAVRGISITSTSTNANYNVYYNTVYLNATSTGANFGTTGIFHTSNATSTTAVLNLNNNIIINKSAFAGTGLSVAFRRSGASLSNYGLTSNNNLFYCGAPGASNLIYNDGTNSDQLIGAYQARVSPVDNSSLTEDAPFVSTTGSNAGFLKINPSIATLVESHAANIATYTDDFDGDIRQGNGGYAGAGSAPDIGADEVEGTPSAGCFGTPTAGTISGTSPICSGGNTALTLSGATTDLGITYQWQSSTTAGGPYTNLGTASAQATGALTSTTYYIATLTCTNSSMSATTSEFTVTVNPNPIVGLTPSTGTICLPGGASIPLTASNATSYTWLPSAGLSATTGASVTANPTSTTTYTVTGTDGNGCSGTATAVITVSNNPSISATTATPSTICLGGTSQLNVATSATVANYLFAGSTGTYTPIVGTAVPGAIGDDNGTGNLPIGFNFGYNGNTYSVFGVWSNGNVQLGNTTVALTGNFTNNLATSTDMIATLWDDNNTTGGSVSYLTTGTAPNRVLTIQWTGMHVGGAGSSTNPTIDMQLMLFETTGEVRIVYGSTSAALTGTTASIGISGTAGQYMSVTPASPASSSTASSSASNNTISSATDFPSGTVYSFTPPTNTYAWTPAGNLNNAAISNPVSSGLTSTTQYTVVVTNSFGCNSTSTVDVTVSPLTSAGISSSPSTPICVGASSTLTSTPVGGGPFTYTWMPGSGSTSSYTVTPAATTMYTVTVNNSCGESVIDSVLVTVNTLPAVSATAASNLYCTPGSPAIALTAGGASTYTWLPTAGLDFANVATPNASPATTTTYTVTGTDGNGCQNTATVAITAAPAVTSITAAAMPSTICAGDSVDLSSSAVVNGTLLLEDFNAPTNAWTTVNNSVNGTPAAAAWTLKASGTTSFGNAITSNDNSQMYVSDSDAQGSGSTTNTSLTSPRIDASNYSTLSLSFYHFFRFNAVPDAGNVEVSTDGTNYTVVQSYTATTGAAAAFNNGNINLNAYAGNDTLYVRFSYKSSWGWGWAIDNVSLTGALSTLNYAWTSNPGGFSSAVQNPTGVVPTGTTTYDVVISNGMGCSDTASATVTVNPLPVVALGNDSTLCYVDAPVTLDAGNSGASYLWNTTETTQTISVDSSYSYSVEVTDANGCVGMDTINVTVNAQPVVNLGTDSTQCGGTVTLDAGNAGATFLWNDNSSAQTLVVANSGTYNVSVTSPQGCESTDTVVVTINAMPTDNLGNDTLFCGSNLTLDAGNAGSTYAWNTTETTQTINVTSSGQYFVTITTAQNCSDVDTVNITIAPAVSVSLGNDSAVCQSTSIILDAQNPGATYLWNDNSNSSTLIVANPGTYYVMVTSVDGCTATDTVVFSDNSPVVTLSLPFTTTCVNTSVNTLSGGAPSGGFYSGPGVTGTNFNATTVGSFLISYTYTDGTTGCAATDTQTVVVDPCVGLVKTNNVANIVVAPNPNNGIFTINVPSKEGKYVSEVYSLDGKLISKEILSGRENYEMNLSNLANAIYYLRLTIDGETSMFKVVKQD